MSRSDVTLIAVVLVLAFLFVGDPDVWDLLLASAKRALGDGVCL